MAENLSRAENEARFVEYPYDLHETWWNDLQKRKMRVMAGRIHPNEVVLDVGCNSGYLPEFLPRGCVAHGIDLSPALVEKARARGYQSVQVAGAEALPFPDKSMDVTFLAGVIEYPFDPELAMREAARVARRIVLVEACHEEGVWGRHRIPTHAHMVRSYDEASLRALCETVGQVTFHQVVEGFGQKQHRVMEVTL